ncbi:MAG: hypothetical protein LIP08_12360, partial [Bacteroides sp.]|nr:hypothetical protein [Bacteroides sp.]
YQYMEDQDALMAICFVVALIYVGVGTVVETVVMAHSKFAMWGETRAQEYYVNRIIDQNILKLWVFADKPDVQTYNTVDKLYNDIIEVSHHFAEVMALSEETKDNLIRLGLGTLGKGTDTKNKKE